MIQTIKTDYYFQLLKQVPGWAKRVPDELPGPRGGTTQIMVTNETHSQIKEELKISTGRITRLLKIATRNMKPKTGRVEMKQFPLAKLVFREGDPGNQDCYIRNTKSSANPAGVLEIGRAPSREGRPYIILNHQNVSRKHATIIYQNQKLSIINHSEVNPVIINQTVLKQNKHVCLPEKAVIHIGPFEFTVEKLK